MRPSELANEPADRGIFWQIGGFGFSDGPTRVAERAARKGDGRSASIRAPSCGGLA